MIHEILSHFKKVNGVNGKYMACCPAHDDTTPSLSITEKDGKTLIYCYAGCKYEDILAAAGLEKSDFVESEDQYKPQKVNEQSFEYYDKDGKILYYKIRAVYNDGTKKFFFKQPNGKKGVVGVQRVPYNLPAVLNSQTIYFVEGEKCAEAIIETGEVATTLDSGAKSKWLPEYNEYFKNKTVIIIPDNDEPGMTYAKRINKNILGSKIVTLSGLDDKEDVYDWLNAGHKMEEISDIPSELPSSSTTDTDRQPTQAEKLLDLVEHTGATFFHSNTNDIYASIPVDGHNEIWAIDHKDFNLWLSSLYYKTYERPATKDAITQTITILSAKALFENSKPVALYTRVAEYQNEFWYDLTNSKWQAVKITPTGWSVVDNPPILFNRYRHQSESIIPAHNGDINRILKYINLKNNQTLFLCWLVSCFIPDIPHVMPIFYGEKGAAKSTTCSLLKKLIDPSVLDTLTLQKDNRSLAVNLQQHWFLPFDNVSHINEETSDTLCRAITGGGIQQRKLCTNAEDYIFTFKRCLAVNGINNVANRSDLLDRSLLVELERISESDRRELSKINKEFQEDCPIILGGIFETLYKAMSIFKTVSLENLPRMADFAKWGYSIGEALGGQGETFLTQYEINRGSQNTEVINADPVATLIVALMNDHNVWEGYMAQLFTKLVQIAPEYGINPKIKAFPSQPNVLSRRLNGIKSNLESVGILFENHNNANGVLITLNKRNSSPLQQYHHGVSNTNTLPDGDIMEINTDNGGNKFSSPYVKLSSTDGFDVNEDNGDNIADFNSDDQEVIF